eukprot:jgi/Tetstr1/462999/TSEL_007938.t1
MAAAKLKAGKAGGGASKVRAGKAAAGVAKKKKAAEGGAKAKPTAPVMDIAPLKAGSDSEGEDPFLELQPSSSGGENSAVVYVGRIPHGFYENQMKGFFSQFGDIKRWCVSRSKRTARSKGYAFVEFAEPEVAVIAADAMDGYLMFKQALRCHVMKASDVHPAMFAGGARKFRKVPWRKIEAERHNNEERTAEQMARRQARALRRDAARQKALAAAGIEYEYQGLAAQLPRKPAHKKF